MKLPNNLSRRRCWPDVAGEMLSRGSHHIGPSRRSRRPPLTGGSRAVKYFPDQTVCACRALERAPRNPLVMQFRIFRPARKEVRYARYSLI
jgi:hypothetical protein